MNVLIISPSGRGNAGDDVCALAAQGIVRNAQKHVNVRVVSPKFNKNVAETADVFILSGGGIINDISSPNFGDFVPYIDFALNNNKTVIGLGLGEDGVLSKASANKYKSLLSKLDLLTVRSMSDAQLLMGMGVKTAVLSHDLSLNFDFSPYRKKRSRRGALKRDLNKINRPKLGVVLKVQEHQEHHKKLAFSKDEKLNALHFKNNFEKQLEHISRSFEVTIIAQTQAETYLAQDFKDDYGVKNFIYNSEKDLHKLLNTFAKQDLILSQRLHGTIFSIMLDLPVITLGYHGQKQFKLLKDISEQAKLVMYHKPANLDALLNELSLNSSSLQKRLITVNEDTRYTMTELAKINSSLLIEAMPGTILD